MPDRFIIFALFWIAAVGTAVCQSPVVQQTHPMALLPFAERGREVTGLGQKVNDLLFAKLVSDPDLFLVDRQELDDVITETELNVSGLVRPDQAIRLAQMTGAKLLVTGSVFEVDQSLHLIARVIGTETTRIKGVAVHADIDSPLVELVDQLANELTQAIQKHSVDLVASPAAEDNRLDELIRLWQNEAAVTVSLAITERHVSGTDFDPAAETAMAAVLEKCGVNILTGDRRGRVDYEITGQAISEFATRTKGLVSVKARVEIKVIDARTGERFSSDHQTRIEVGLAEQLTGKSALRHCGEELAIRLLSRLPGKSQAATP